MKTINLQKAYFMDGLEALSDERKEAPKSFVVLKYGKTQYTKGQERGEYEFSPEDADKVLADFETRKKDLVIDYEHQTLSGQEAPAAGWVDRLEKTADGLVAHVKYWTNRALNHLGQGEYRYFSPVFHGSRRHPTALHSIAMTNHPATHGIPALVMADESDPENDPNQKENKMEKILTLLGIQALSDNQPAEAAILEAIQGLQSAVSGRDAFLKLHDCQDLDAVTGKIKGMVPAAELIALNDRLAGIEAEKAVGKAFSDRKLIEAQRGWAIDYAKKDLKAFSDFIAAQPVVSPAPASEIGLQKQENETVSLSDDEIKIYKRLGLTDEQIKEMKGK